jgi:RHS repeat-associated protein
MSSSFDRYAAAFLFVRHSLDILRGFFNVRRRTPVRRARRRCAMLVVAASSTAVPCASLQADGSAVAVTATGLITQDNSGLNDQFLGQPYVLTMSFDAATLAQTCNFPTSSSVSCQTTGNPAAETTTLTIPGAPTITTSSAIDSSFFIQTCCNSQLLFEKIWTITDGNVSLGSGTVDGGILLLTSPALFDPTVGPFQSFTHTVTPADGYSVGFNGNWPQSFSTNIFAFSGTLTTLTMSSATMPPPPPSMGKNLGVPPCPNCYVGNPINAAIGNKFQAETDFVAAPITGLALTRYYNSQDTTSSAFGSGWHSTWHRSLNQISATTVTVIRADGREDTFTLTAGVWQADPDVTSVLTPVPATGTQTGWQVVTSDDTTETYTLAGLLAAVTNRAGLTTVLAYNAGGQLTTVTGPFGDVLSFVNGANGLVGQMTAPDGGVYAYAYDANSNLTSVTYADGSVRQYVYANTSFPHALTAIVDEDGNQYASYIYDAQGRGISSQHAGGADLTTVTYNADGSSSVTDADGNTHTYTLITQSNLVKAAALSGAPYPPAGGQAFTYDNNGFLASRTDYDGNVTAYTHDNRGDETSRTEASGTAIERTIATTWLPNFHLPATISEPGRVTSLGYDANGNLLQKTITAGSLTRSWTYTYNGSGQVLTATDPLGHVTAYTYDSTGDITTITDPLGHVTAFTSYDSNGRPLSFTDPNGLVTALTYNFRGQVTSRNAGGEVTTYTYDPAGQLIKLTRPDGSYLAYIHDAAHRLTGIADAVGESIVYTYDPASNVIISQVLDPAGNLSQTRGYTYDAVNRVAQAIGAQGQTTAYVYDPNSNLTGVTDPLSHVNAYGYDALNRRVQAVDPKNGATDFGYDALNHLTSVVDPRDLTTSYGWDGLDDQITVASPDSGVTARSFDAAGNVITSTDARGLTTSYQYDALNRPVLTTYADGSTVTRQYDQSTYGVGHLTAMTDLSGTTTWTYDQHGRVLTKAQTIAGTTFTTAMSYDTAGRPASITYPSGAVITVSYDAAGRASGLASGGVPLVSSVTYFPFAQAQAWMQGNGALYSRTFDQDGRIAGIGFGSSMITLAYDPASRITGMTETGLPNKIFGYDELDRVTSYSSGSITLSYGYDSNGNRISLGAGATVTSYTIDPGSNRLLGSSTGSATRALGYDADGNVTADNQPLVNYAYSYDASGRLVAAMTGGFTTTYTNDGSGERVSRGGYGATTPVPGAGTFVYDAAGHLLGEYSSNGSAIEETVWLGDLPVAVLMPKAAPFYVAPDHLGSPHQIANAAGGMVWLWDHDPFGNGVPSGSLTYNLRFPGQYFNQETGLHYNGFRDYDPSTGRYVQSDPIGLLGGFNVYDYVNADPLLEIDPRALDPFIGAPVGAIFGGVTGATVAILNGGGLGEAGAAFGTGFVFGGIAGLFDPTLGLGTLALIGGVSGGAGDLLTQYFMKPPGVPYNFCNTAVATATSAIAAVNAANLADQLGALGLSELGSTVGSTSLSTPPLITIPTIGSYLCQPAATTCPVIPLQAAPSPLPSTPPVSWPAS